MNWLIPANAKKYNFVDAFEDLTILDWTENANYNVGDTIYIYGSKPYQRIMYRTEVISVGIKHEDSIDDLKYWVNGIDSIKPSDTTYIRLRVISKLQDDRLSLDNLMKHGLKRAPQGPMRVKGDLLICIESIDTDITLKNYGLENRKLLNTEKEAIIKVRIGQGGFRERLINKDKKCRICGLANKKLLIASHIKSWIFSNEKERVDENNGILLCPNHDALFDTMAFHVLADNPDMGIMILPINEEQEV